MTSLEERRSLFSRKRKASESTIRYDDYIFDNNDETQGNFEEPVTPPKISKPKESVVPAKSSKDNEKLYESAEYTVDEFFKSFMLVCRNANVSDATADKFLHLFKVFLPLGNKCPSTFKTVRNYFEKILLDTIEPEEIDYCKNCCTLLKPNENCGCGKNQVKQNGLLQVYSIKPQIEAIVEKHESAIIAYRNLVKSYPEGYYMDSRNGEILSAIKEPIFPLNFYNDGVSLSKSGNKELLIIGFTIVDLPMKARFARSNFVYAASWYSSDKTPPFKIFSQKIIKQLKDGVVIDGIFCPFKVIQLQGDMPAKAKVGNYKEGGYQTCIRCNIRGNRIEKVIQYNDRNFQIMTPESYREEVKKVLNGEKESCIKGSSAFAEVMRFPTCITGDVMHSVYYGPPRDDLKDTQKKEAELVEILKVKIIKNAFDAVIENIKLPVELSNRNLRVTSESTHFKASEWKAILFYVAPVVLPHFLIERNLTGKNKEKTRSQIFNLLECVAAIACLMQDIVKEEGIQHAENLLNTWFDERNGLFEHNVYVPKTHDIMHFPNQVRLHGPLQCSSCFGGENVLQTVNNMVTCKVPRTILTQISQRLSYLNILNKWRSQQQHKKLKGLLNQIEKKTEETESEYPIPNDVLVEIFGEDNLENDKSVGLKFYENSGYIYYPTISLRKKNNDSICYFKDETGSFKIGTIQRFIKINNTQILAQIQPLTIKPLYRKFDEEDLLGNSKSFLFYGIVDSSKNHELVIVAAENIVKKAFLIESLNKFYVVPVLHVFEHN